MRRSAPFFATLALCGAVLACSPEAGKYSAEVRAEFETLSGYAGSWTNGGRTTVALVRGTDPAPFAARLRGDPRPPEFVYVQHSYADINAAADTIASHIDDIRSRGMQFVFSERDIMGNRVCVGVVDPTAQDIEYLKSFGAPITVEAADPIVGG